MTAQTPVRADLRDSEVLEAHVRTRVRMLERGEALEKMEGKPW
jgi:hypothetical protein